MGKKFLFTIAILIAISNAHAQDSHVTITGQLVDDEADPLPFASIYVKGTSIGTTSNVEGLFVFHIPNHLKDNIVVISSIGYRTVERVASGFEKGGIISLQESTLNLDEVVVNSEKTLTAKQIVKKAYGSLDKNYPTEPYILEGFVRDLQNEDSTYVELLECATKMYYRKYDVKIKPRIELLEVRRNYIANKHPWNDEWDRKNSIIDLVEDDFIRFDYGPIKVGNGWKYEIKSILPFGDKLVYKIEAVNKPYAEALFFIDINSFAFIRIEYSRSMHNRRYYKRRLTNGQQEAFYSIVFEYQEYKGKWYLKYQKEEDTWRIFKGLETNKLLFTKYPKKELFVNKIITENVDQYPFNRNLQVDKSIESQAKLYNPDFWKYYNAPARTSKLSKIEEYLKNAQIEVEK